jgi:spoIIIJ-associated protein
VEWVETTGRTIEDAKEAALDELGVDESDAEFEVLEEPRAGLFGRLRSEARVRARVRPTAPRAKEDRRDRRRRNRVGSEDSGGRRTDGAGATTGPDSAAGPGSRGEVVGAATGGGLLAAAPDVASTERSDPASSPVGATAESGGAAQPAGRTGGRRRARRGSPNEASSIGGTPDPEHNANSDQSVDTEQREDSDVEVALDEQGRVAQQFLTQLTAEFGVQATVEIVRPDEDTVDLHLRGSDLGLLIGPKGTTLLAIQDLTRTVVHHQTGAGNGRMHVDVGGYRQKRSEALARFALQVATTVKQSGNRTVLEPMSAADRKVVHDAITPIEGVSTVSEGEEPRRRVVVLPADR